MNERIELPPSPPPGEREKQQNDQESRVDHSQYAAPLATASTVVAGSGHTPGPWLNNPTGEHRRCIEARAFDGSWHYVCQSVHGGSPREADANARLIAAAPTMYQELELAADTFRDISNVLRVIGKDVMSAAADIAERHIREQLAVITQGGGLVNAR